MNSNWHQPFASTLSLFTSLGTLICCALPALLVSLGMGAVVAGLITAVPQLIWLSAHKPLVFGVAGVMLAASLFVQYLSRNAPCPTDPKQAKACAVLRRFSWGITLVSFILYVIGAFFAFGLKYFI